MGSIGYYRRFIDHFADSSALLTPHTSSKSPGKVVWHDDMVYAFRALCTSLCNFSSLNVPLCNDVYVLHTDASAQGVGVVLNVCRDAGPIITPSL